MKLICLYCGKEFESIRTKKYCSSKCCRSADRDNKRIQYVGKRKEFCEVCGKPLPKFKTRYCGRRCQINKKPAKELVCEVCGKSFMTYKDNVFTCSTECSQIRRKKIRNEKDKLRYKNAHPSARTMDEVLKTSKERKEKKQLELEQRRIKRESDLQKARAKKQKEKQMRIDYWQNYCQLHECAVCGELYVAHYPLSKYCSDKCKRIQYRTKDRYEDITIDKGITLRKVARKNKDICQLCGKIVDWNDYHKKDGVIVCGNNYPSIDHVIPISKGGMHSWDNVQLAHRICNTLKSNN